MKKKSNRIAWDLYYDGLKMTTQYYKITNERENHYGYQYEDGINYLPDKFNEDGNMTCCAGGFYFTTIEYILMYIGFGVYLREVTLPKRKAFRMVKDASGTKYRANMIRLGSRYNLADLSTLEFLIENGADFTLSNHLPLRYYAMMGNLPCVKYLVELGADVNAENDAALKHACDNDHYDVAKYLVENGANIEVDDYYPLRIAQQRGYDKLAKYLFRVDKSNGTWVFFTLVAAVFIVVLGLYFNKIE